MIFSEKFESPLGTMIACSTDKGICLLTFESENSPSAEHRLLEKHFKKTIKEGTNEHLKTLILELNGYFKGTLREFTVPLDSQGTAFQVSVWNELMKIKFGETRSYLEQSAALGNPRSIRAVAHANGMNRIAIIIPCHRIIGSDGSLTGYAGGLQRKKWLLEHEKKYSGKIYEPVLF